MASSMGPDRKVTDGLVLYLDATSTKSYPGSGTVWTDLISNETTCSFINGPTVTASFGGGYKIVLDATDDYMEVGVRDSLNPTQYITVASWVNYKSYTQYWAPIIFKKTTGNSYYEQYALSMDSDGYPRMKIGNGSNSNTGIGPGVQYKNQLIYLLGIIDTPNRAGRVYVDGTCVASASHTFATMTTSTVNLRIGGANVSNFQGWFGGDIYTAEVYNRVLTDAEILQNYNAVAEKYGKNVVVTDLDALSFVNAAQLTSETQKKAINDLVVDLKSNNLWSKMKAIYPMVGGSAASHKWNLKDPRDLNAAFRLTFSGGWTHSSTGARPNGTNGYADTYLIPQGNLTAGNVHLSYYNRTSTLVSQYEQPIGSQGDPSYSVSKWILISYYKDASVNNITGVGHDSYAYANARNTGTDYSGYAIMSRLNASSLTTLNYVGNTTTGSSLGATPQNITSAKLYLGSVSNLSDGRGYSFPSQLECAFATIGNGLTDTDAANLYTIVQKYQTTLGRQV